MYCKHIYIVNAKIRYIQRYPTHASIELNVHTHLSTVHPRVLYKYSRVLFMFEYYIHTHTHTQGWIEIDHNNWSKHKIIEKIDTSNIK